MIRVYIIFVWTNTLSNTLALYVDTQNSKLCIYDWNKQTVCVMIKPRTSVFNNIEQQCHIVIAMCVNLCVIISDT